jgi:hypothetical protein
LAFQKALREQIWLKVLLAGSSGSGKTYSALRLATGVAKACGSKVAAIDTENGRIRYYADEFEFDDQQLEVPFTPEKYIEAIDEAADAGYRVLIIDSITHEWDYCNDVHNKMPGNSWANWAKITPRHDAFMEKILQSPMHVIATVRGKDEYVLEEKNGKQTPKKVGLGFKQRDNVEYNYTVTFNLAQDTHIADVMKDNTHLFEGRYEVLTEKDGTALYKWANEGKKAEPRPTKTEKAPTEEEVLATTLNLIKDAGKLAVDRGVEKDAIGEAVKAIAGTANYNKIKDINVLKQIFETINNMGANE